MPMFKKKPVIIEAITFDELVEYGKENGGNIVNGMPWSFTYKGQPITHENDDCYLIPTLEGTMRFERGDMLIAGVKGEIYPCKPDIFAATYEPVSAAREEARARNLATSREMALDVLAEIDSEVGVVASFEDEGIGESCNIELDLVNCPEAVEILAGAFESLASALMADFQAQFDRYRKEVE